MTTYVVLAKDPEQAPDWWIVQGEYEARDARAAVAAHVRGSEHPNSTYVAVPLRSFKPVTVGVETQTRLTFT